MELQICILFLPLLIINGMSLAAESTAINNTHPDKDLYVIRATVYQIGILTNKTDNITDGFNSTANQESITLYHTNGSNIDLSGIPEPLLTNVTAQSMVGVAPVPRGRQNITPTWDGLKVFTRPNQMAKVNNPEAETNERADHLMTKRSTDYVIKLFRRDTNNNTPVKIVNGTALIPPEAGVQSIALPPLLSLNNNMSNIPVPIPNTSVIHYVKVNTLIQKPLKT